MLVHTQNFLSLSNHFAISAVHYLLKGYCCMILVSSNSYFCGSASPQKKKEEEISACSAVHYFISVLILSCAQLRSMEN